MTRRQHTHELERETERGSEKDGQNKGWHLTACMITKWRNMEDSICCVVTTDDRGRRRRKEDEREEDTAQHEYVNLCCYESA